MARIARLLAVSFAVALWGASSFDEALRLYSQREFARAEQVLRKALQQKPGGVQERFLLGATLIQLQRNAEAIDELMRVAQAQPRHSDAVKLLASELLAVRRYADAIRVLTPLLTPGPADEETHLLIVQAYQDRNDAGDAEKASQLAARALARFPKSPQLLAWKGYSLREAGRLDEARQTLELALQLDPDSIQAKAFLADVLRRKGDFPSAIALFQVVLQAEPNDVESRLGLSRALAESGRPEEAVAELVRARDAAPQHARIRLELSQLYARLGQAEKAREEAEAFRRLNRVR